MNSHSFVQAVASRDLVAVKAATDSLVEDRNSKNILLKALKTAIEVDDDILAHVLSPTFAKHFKDNEIWQLIDQNAFDLMNLVFDRNPMAIEILTKDKFYIFATRMHEIQRIWVVRALETKIDRVAKTMLDVYLASFEYDCDKEADKAFVHLLHKIYPAYKAEFDLIEKAIEAY